MDIAERWLKRGKTIAAGESVEPGNYSRGKRFRPRKGEGRENDASVEGLERGEISETFYIFKEST